MWHVSSRSGVATLRTAIRLLLIYLLSAVLAMGLYQSVCHSRCSIETDERIELVFGI